MTTVHILIVNICILYIGVFCLALTTHVGDGLNNSFPVSLLPPCPHRPSVAGHHIAHRGHTY